MTPDPDSLDRLLDRWERAVPPPPDRLAAEVWQRIAVADAPLKTGWFARVHGAFARPSFAVAFVVACTLLGLFLAEVRRSRLQSEYNTALIQSYLRLIDPLLETTRPAPAGLVSQR